MFSICHWIHCRQLLIILHYVTIMIILTDSHLFFLCSLQSINFFGCHNIYYNIYSTFCYCTLFILSVTLYIFTQEKLCTYPSHLNPTQVSLNLYSSSLSKLLVIYIILCLFYPFFPLTILGLLPPTFSRFLSFPHSFLFHLLYFLFSHSLSPHSVTHFFSSLYKLF